MEINDAMQARMTLLKETGYNVETAQKCWDFVRGDEAKKLEPASDRLADGVYLIDTKGNAVRYDGEDTETVNDTAYIGIVQGSHSVAISLHDVSEDEITLTSKKDDGKDIEDYPLTFEDACEFLGDKEIAKSAVAFYKLSIIAKAWNKIDGFVPDFSNIDQSKHFPWFLYRTEHAGFVCTGTSNSASSANSAIGSRLCFESSAIAQKFGETFTELYNEMFF